MAGRPAHLGAVIGSAGVAFLLLPACSQQSPVAPERLSRSAAGAIDTSPSASAGSPSAAVHPNANRRDRFDLLDGTFTFVLASGTLSGTYSGVASAPGASQPRATLDLIVTGGTNALAGASGSLGGTATGALNGEGEFLVSLRGTVAASQGSALDLRVALRGTTTISCTNGGLTHLTLNGTGTARNLGAATGTLQHDLGNAGCSGAQGFE